MRQIPLDIGPVHFVGIGGIGMSGIAEVMHNLGYWVQGSDITENANTKRLRSFGIKINLGHAANNIGGAQVLVISSAVNEDNSEIRAARERLIPVVRRAEMLGELMRLNWSIAIGGTHGKATTTSLIATVLDCSGYDPTVINGGIINAYDTNARLGEGDWMVVEADESDGSFIKLPATIAVVTNIDPEHLDFYENFESERRAYQSFVENIPFYGFAALCIDHPEVQAMIGRIPDRRIVTYGVGPQADVRALEVEQSAQGAKFDVAFSDRMAGAASGIRSINLPMPGDHNVLNGLAAIAVAREMGIADAKIKEALALFKGVKRRFTRTGQTSDITVIDADLVIVADVYSAGEEPIEGMDSYALVDGLRAHGHKDVLALTDSDNLAQIIARRAESGDVVMCLGAGDITTWAESLPEMLAEILGEDPPILLKVDR